MSYNEWIEGTQIEPATKSPPNENYISYGEAEPEDFYLARTAHWTDSWRSRDCRGFNQSHWFKSQYESDISAYLAKEDAERAAEKLVKAKPEAHADPLQDEILVEGKPATATKKGGKKSRTAKKKGQKPRSTDARELR